MNNKEFKQELIQELLLNIQPSYYKKSVVNRGGYFENNIQLSTLRAANVREALLNDMGKEYSNRIGVAGYGETRLKNKVDPLSAENRRIEIRILWNGKEDK